jgi:DNA-binding beta-propeller fold protein YncE
LQTNCLRSVTLSILCLFAVQEILAQQKAAPASADALPNQRLLPGLLADGRVQLPNQWSLKPVGKQLVLGDFPANIAMHPTEPYAAIIHSGHGQHEIAIVDLKKESVTTRVNLTDTFWGITFSPDGKQLFASGGVSETIHQFSFDQGLLGSPKSYQLGPARVSKYIPCGVTTNQDGTQLYVANTWGQSICSLDLQAEKVTPKFLAMPKESFPYTILPNKTGDKLFVSLWGAAGIAVVDAKENKLLETWSTKPADTTQVGDHPTEMQLSPDGERLFVACANSNMVVVLSTKTGKPLEVITSALYPRAPIGSTPTSISLSKSGKVLLIANSDNNNIAMIDVSTPGKSQSLGHIPVGWYPTSVRFGLDDQIYVANGKGSQSFANPQGPQPELKGNTPTLQYIGGLMKGTLSMIKAPSPAEMGKYSELARQCSPLMANNEPSSKPREANNPIPAKVGDASPIKHCIYVIKENRTYDQVLGDLPQGNGDANLCLFPRKVTPNHHAIAEQFVLLDNFYVESEVSADGHEWSMAAYATDFVERAWPLNYRGGLGSKIGYPSEGKYDIAASAGGYIWDRCREAKVTYRSYGEFVNNGKTPNDPRTAAVPGLEGHFAPNFHSYDLNYPDNKRVDSFIEELREFEKNGNFPQFIVIRLPNDHTSGTSIGKPTPTAMVAENDLAFGRFVEAVSTSKFWPQTAIFVVEDDAQNGSDHVDAHRTIAFVVSPYTKRKFVDSTMYSTSSMLRSMELILGLKPMTQFDAAATPMYESFTSKPDLAPYKHVPAIVDINAVNVAGTYGAAESAKMDFSKEDAADDLLLNEIIWRSIRGAHSKMPPPVRASFVRVLPEDEDEEEEDKEEEEEEEEKKKLPPTPAK